MSVEEIIGFVTGALCVWLAVRQNVWTFPVGIANNIAFGWLFVGSGLYAGAALQVVFLVLAALGWYWWRGGTRRRALAVRRTPRRAWPVALAATAVLTALLLATLTLWTDSTAPFWDGLTTASSVVAQVMLGRKWLGNWGVWIATDVALVGLYASQGLWLTAVLYTGYIAMCVAGWRQWTTELPAPDAGASLVPIVAPGATPAGTGDPVVAHASAPGAGHVAEPAKDLR